MNTIDATTLRLAAVIDTSDDAIISQTIDGTIETWNRAAERLFGYTPREAVGQPIDLIVPPDQREIERDAMAAVRAGGGARHFETVALRRDGSTVAVSLAISPVMTPDGQLIGISRIARDITQQQALQREALRLAAIVDSSEDSIVSKDLNGIVQTWNKAAERTFGYRADEVVGRHISIIIPEDRRSEEDELIGRIRQGHRVEHFETVRRHKDGRLLDVSLSISPIRTPDGTVIGASKIARDVTQQRLLEREALRLAAIVASSEDAIVSKDLNGIVQTWNRSAERMFGYTPEEMIGRSITTIIPPDRLAEEDLVLSNIRAGRSVEHFETMRRRKDGSLIEISVTISPIRTADGRVIGASKIVRDITGARQLARAAEDANRVKDEFLAMLSHELRTPLNAVLGYTRMLRTGHFEGDEGRREQVIDIIERNAKMLSQLVSDVLDVSGIVTGKIRVTLEPCDLVPVVQAAIDIVRPSADAKGVELRVKLPPVPLRVQCDSDRMQQVCWNLLSNAVKFTPPGGHVDVEVAAGVSTADIMVRDTGVGIRAESLRYVFQRFWQGETAHERQGGLGLGLALARHFVELHGGTITVDSAGEGQGATFTVSLPLSTRGE